MIGMVRLLAGLAADEGDQQRRYAIPVIAGFAIRLAVDLDVLVAQ